MGRKLQDLAQMWGIFGFLENDDPLCYSNINSIRWDSSCLEEHALLPLFYLYSFSLKLATAYEVSTINPNSGVEAETKWNPP